MKKINVNNLKCNIGQKKNGVELGGDYLIELFNNTDKYTINSINFTNNHDYLNAYNIIEKQDDFIINLGGDHSVGAVTVQSQLNKYNDDLLVIWIDAHADLNTYESSISKNTHGMPVAPLLGLMNHWWDATTCQKQLKPENLLYIGIRDLDLPEIETINNLNISYFTNWSNDINEWISKHPATKIHISFDIDSLDPLYTPSTGTIANDGLHVEDIKKIIDISINRLVGFDLVEFNPLIGTPNEILETTNNCKVILNHLINHFH